MLRSRTRNIKHEPVEKICLDCECNFQDTSKKKLVVRCKPCINNSMVATRYARGSYERSEEQNEKLSITLKTKYESGWNPNTEEHREKLSEGMKARWQDGSMRKKSVATTLEKYGVEHWAQSEEGKTVLSQRSRGRKFSDETRKNMSQGAARRIRENNNHYERGNGGFREDLGHYVRSNWEANFARILKIQGKSYEYEPKTFQIAEDKTYTPDFLVDGIFYEVKGYWTEKSKLKLESFVKIYPEIELQIIDGTKYNELREAYQDLIHWEGK